MRRDITDTNNSGSEAMLFKLAIGKNIGYHVFLKNGKLSVAALPQDVPRDPCLLASFPFVVPSSPSGIRSDFCSRQNNVEVMTCNLWDEFPCLRYHAPLGRWFPGKPSALLWGHRNICGEAQGQKKTECSVKSYTNLPALWVATSNLNCAESKSNVPMTAVLGWHPMNFVISL